MGANLHAFEHNNLDEMTLFPAPKYGHTLHPSWAQKHQSAITSVEEWRHALRLCGGLKRRTTRQTK